MDSVNLTLTDQAGEFAARVGDFLTERAERNVAATVLASVLEGRYSESGARFGHGLDAAQRMRFAVLRTPPWPLLVSDLDPGMAEMLIERWLELDPHLPGVSGLPASAAAVAAAWRARTGGQTECRMQMAMHCLERVAEPSRPAPGELRGPTADERRLLIEWNAAFERDAGVVVTGQAEAVVDERLAHGGWWLWDDGGPVSLVGVTRQVAGAVRLGPVYTPPECRNRGYATSAVATASGRALEAGARRCLLFTDLANPTSNRIYASVGYRRIAGWEEHSFWAG